MLRSRLVLFAIAAALSIAAQPAPKKQPTTSTPPTNATPTKQPPAKSTQDIVEVAVIVGLKTDLDKLCNPQASATAIFIATNDKAVYHCVGNKLLNHAMHDKVKEMDAAIVRVKVGQQIRWRSETRRFFIAGIQKHTGPGSSAPPKTDVPNNPFGEFLKAYVNQVTSGEVPDLPGNVIQRYKVSFNIEGVGLIDPDVVCSM